MTDFILLGSKITADSGCSHEIRSCLLLRGEVMTNLDIVVKSREGTLLTKVYIVEAMVLPVVMYRCDSWTIKKTALKKWCFQIVVLEKTLESPLDNKEIKPVNPKGNQSWIFIGRTDAEAEVPILWPPDLKRWLIRKDWCWERLKTGGERGDRGWDGWIASPTQWTWVWISSFFLPWSDGTRFHYLSVLNIEF